ncbi:GGDEF domain-containing protein [Sulfurovum sp. TSL1]|uniref:GGDEF domain-containing protein n=1 Tax=Sulfurovum sp. TSL1 TaxID=2826994 RepID=UPI001CC6DDA3|nr:GGDEF domain-containing protein [Sulfurovum sp. TSL1]
MNINNFLHSGFKFTGDENLQQFKFKMLNSILIIVVFFSLLFALLSDLGMNDIGPIHTKVNYVYSFLTLMLIYFLRLSKQNDTAASHALLMISLITFTSALIFVPQDEFRIIWFYLLIFVAYIINGKISGLLYTLASITIILIANFTIDLHLSNVAIHSAILGLIIGSFLSDVYTSKINNYESSLKQQNSSLSILASTDYLTGVMNRRMFNQISEHYFDTAQQGHLSLTLLLLDLDHFKKINDTYGHQTGDQLLISFVQTVKNLLRKSDIFSRIGGEEFAILLSQIDKQDAYLLAEKIRKAVENITVHYEGHNVYVRTSIGIAQNSATDSSFDDIFSRSDMALYKAKKEGRNRTCCAAFSEHDINCPQPLEQAERLDFSI